MDDPKEDPIRDNPKDDPIRDNTKDDTTLVLRETLSKIGRKLLDKEWDHLAFLYLKDSSGIKSWVQLMRELVDKELVTSSKKDLCRLVGYLKEIRRDSLTEIVRNYQSSLATDCTDDIEMEKNMGSIENLTIKGSSIMPSLKRPREELLLEETLSCSSLADCDSTFQKIDEDEDQYDEENALGEEERREHKQYVDLANECAKESPDPQTKVGAVVVNSKKEVIGTGCNRMPARCEGKLPWKENRDEPLENGKHPYVVYAIVVAILAAIKNGSFDDLKDSTLYATLYPSNTCAQIIQEVGISKVVYTTKKFSNTKFRKAARRILEPDVKCRYYAECV